MKILREWGHFGEALVLYVVGIPHVIREKKLPHQGESDYVLCNIPVHIQLVLGKALSLPAATAAREFPHPSVTFVRSGSCNATSEKLSSSRKPLFRCCTSADFYKHR